MSLLVVSSLDLFASRLLVSSKSGHILINQPLSRTIMRRMIIVPPSIGYAFVTFTSQMVFVR